MDILTSLKKEKKELESKLKKVSNAIKALEPVPIQYMQWRIKAMECIRKENRYCQTVEILECTIGKKILNDTELRKRYVTALSVALTYLCKDGELKKFALKKRKGDFYGLPEWFDGDGIPKENLLNKLFNVGGRNIRDLLRA